MIARPVSDAGGNVAVKCSSCPWRGKLREGVAVPGSLTECPLCGEIVLCTTDEDHDKLNTPPSRSDEV